MSYIPNKAIPHAAPVTDDEDDFENTGFYEWDGEEEDASVLERMAELARDNPRTALGAGIALIAGAVAGLAWPFFKSKPATPKRKTTPQKRTSTDARSSASSGLKGKRSPARKTKAAKAGATRTKATIPKRRATKVSQANSSAPKTRAASAKATSTAGAAKTRKPRSDKGAPRAKGPARASSMTTPASAS